MPTRREMEQRFDVSGITIKLALEHLHRDGFVWANTRQGTFVVDAPPHLTQFGLCFESHPGATTDPPWTRFFTALMNEASAIQKTSPRRFPIYQDVKPHPDVEDYQRLVADVQARRLAGLLFTTPPVGMIGTPVLDFPGLPRVALMKNVVVPGMVRLTNDTMGLLTKALDYLAARGRKRIAFINVAGLVDAYNNVLPTELAKRRMSTRPYWHHIFGQSLPEASRTVTHLLMQGPANERPDGLLISDDNLVEHATAGLVASGVRIPDDLDVVAHCNFPWPTPSVVPTCRLGFSANQVLQKALSLMDAMRRGEEVPEISVVPAVFEDEIASVREH